MTSVRGFGVGKWKISSGGRQRRLERGRVRGDTQTGKALRKRVRRSRNKREGGWGNNQELKGVGEEGVRHPMITSAGVPAVVSF